MTVTDLPSVIYPDAELIAVSYLTEVLGEPVNVCTELPPEEVFMSGLSNGYVRCIRIGGVSRFKRNLDEPTIDIDVYAPSYEAANNLVATVRAAIESMPTLINNGGAVTDTYEVSGPNRRPESNPQVIRVGFSVGIRIRPL